MVGDKGKKYGLQIPAARLAQRQGAGAGGRKVLKPTLGIFAAGEEEEEEEEEEEDEDFSSSSSDSDEGSGDGFVGLSDGFTPLCPTLRHLPEPSALPLEVGQVVKRAEVIGAYCQYGVLVDLGANVAGLIPTYHDLCENGMFSRAMDTLGPEKFSSVFGHDSRVDVRIHAVRTQKYVKTKVKRKGKQPHDGYVYRFPVEVELVSPGDLSECLAKPLPSGPEGNTRAPVVIPDPSRRDFWEEMARVTGRDLMQALSKVDLRKAAAEYDMARKEQSDNLEDMKIFDPDHDDFNKRRGSPDPLWGTRDVDAAVEKLASEE
mmetsp:Transcript_4213/g.10844  ORF Transcript_4213/g.10844 Transcript_4213/m.10844 type:complete len:317 (+) Transcript_4213:236-1186(+)